MARSGGLRSTKGRRHKSTRTAKHPSRPSLLILHLDADRLRSEGLHLQSSAEFAAAWARFGHQADVVSVDGTNLQHLLQQLGALAAGKRVFDVVLAIGHSNPEGIRIASDEFADWEAFAKYLKPFGPRRLALVACQAGRWPAANVLFRKLPKLRRIYACPVNASKDLGQLMVAMVPLIVEVKVPTKRQSAIAQAITLALTGGQLRQWQRNADKDNPEGQLFDLAATALDPLVQRMPNLLRAVLG